MAQLQWLGTLPKQTSGGYLAEAIGEGVSGYFKKKGEGEKIQREEAKEESIMDLRQKEYDLKFSKIDYDKRKDLYDTMIKMLPNLPEDKQRALTSSSEFTSLEESLGVPSISGTALEAESEMTWSQEQNVSSVRADLARGRGSIKDFYGKPEPTEITTLDEALDYISNKRLDPAGFGEELKRFEGMTPDVEDDKGGWFGWGKKKEETKPAATTKKKGEYTIGQKIEKGGVTYTYTGNGNWSY